MIKEKNRVQRRWLLARDIRKKKSRIKLIVFFLVSLLLVVGIFLALSIVTEDKQNVVKINGIEYQSTSAESIKDKLYLQLNLLKMMLLLMMTNYRLMMMR